MTSLERFNASLAHRPFDRIPYSFDAAPELEEKIRRFLLEMGIHMDLDPFFHKDRKYVLPAYCGNAVRELENGDYTNMFGVRMRRVNFGLGCYSEAVGYPLENLNGLADIGGYPWPKHTDFDYSGLPAAFAQNPDAPFTAGYFALGWYSWEMRGMERFLEDLLLEPALAQGIIEAVAEFGQRYYEMVMQAGRQWAGRNFRCIHLADDWATQDGLLISPALYRSFFKPHYRRFIDLAHREGLLVEFHCCGSVVDLIPELIDSGIDILNPVQTSARGMRPETLKENFGRDIAFSGGLDVQTVMPVASPEAVRTEVFHLLDTLGNGGGYILQPSHCLQADTPLENVFAMCAAVWEYYGCESGWIRDLLARAAGWEGRAKDIVPAG